MSTINDRKALLLSEPIPYVTAAQVRAAGVRVAERCGEDASTVLAMLGITAETLRDGLGYVPEVVA